MFVSYLKKMSLWRVVEARKQGTFPRLSHTPEQKRRRWRQLFNKVTSFFGQPEHVIGEAEAGICNFFSRKLILKKYKVSEELLADKMVVDMFFLSRRWPELLFISYFSSYRQLKLMVFCVFGPS